MDITIFGTVKDKDHNIAKISIHNDEIEELIKQKAIAVGVKGYKGTVWEHYDETIVTVVINS